MTTVALIGGDGAGKSSIARALVDSSQGRMRYLYMGMNPGSANVALPTSKLVYRAKQKSLEADGREGASLHSLEHRKRQRGRLWSMARLGNRLAEEIFRQLLSWAYQLRGAIVVYDRHFLFDFWSTSAKRQPVLDRIHLWFLRRVYPKPDLVLFLDAPSAVLYDRKPEVPVSYLDHRRKAFIQAGSQVERFVTVDAARPLSEVLAEVRHQIVDQLQKKPARGGTEVMKGGRS